MPRDPSVMFFVVRKDVRLDMAAAVGLAGGATVACARRFAGDPRHAEGFAGWRESAYRKVAVRASAAELEAVVAVHDAELVVRAGEPLLACLPPLRRSRAGEPLGALRAFTDARRPLEPTPAPAPESAALTYVLAAELGLTQGKAMAQAGHGALLCADDPALGDRGPRAAAWRAWSAAGRPARVREVDRGRVAAIRAGSPCVVVRDAGFTQVAPGTQTLLCLAPLAAAEEPLATMAPA